jgi:hypothetical protein
VVGFGESATGTSSYGADGCGVYRVYRLRDDGRAEPVGVDVFLVSPVSPGSFRIVAVPSFASRPPSRGESLFVIDRNGVVCRTVVGTSVAERVWDLEACAGARPVHLGAVAVRASDATEAAILETHWIEEPGRARNTDPAARHDDGSVTMWRPFTVVDLRGDRASEVAVYCRRSEPEYECERFMVHRENKTQFGWFFPVERARWAPGTTE